MSPRTRALVAWAVVALLLWGIAYLGARVMDAVQGRRRGRA